MRKQTLIVTIGLALGIFFVAALIYVKSRYSPDRPVNIRARTVTQSNRAEGPHPKPTAPAQAGKELGNDNPRQFLDVISRQVDTLRKNVMPPVEELFAGNPARRRRWYEDSSWPLAEYYQIVQESRANRDFFLPRMASEYRSLHQSLTQVEDLLMDTIREFDFGLPRQQFPPESKERIMKALDDIDNRLMKFIDDLNRLTEKRQ